MPEQADELERIIFTETTTIGIRRQMMERTVLERKQVTVDTSYGPIEAKKVTLPEGSVRIYPEYESVKETARKNGVSFQQVRAEV